MVLERMILLQYVEMTVLWAFVVEYREDGFLSSV